MRNRIKKKLLHVLLIVFAIGGMLFLAFSLSPYPSAWIIRYVFNKEADKANKVLEEFVPDNIATMKDIKYDDEDDDAFMDVYYHRDTVNLKKQLPVIVWTHGGGLLSGNKSQLRSYCMILASKGYLVVSIDYTIAPEGKYPKPLRQLNRALAYITANSEKLHANTSFFVLAGDSAGSMISAATANIITSPEYAKLTKVNPGLNPEQLKGLLLYCGIYQVDNLNSEGVFGSFLKTVTWSYFGKKDISEYPYAKSASVINFLTSSFPPTFISAGNNDPLLPQSKLLARKLLSHRVAVDTLFFPENYTPELGHEYQFTLDKAGNLALDRSLRFLKSITN